MQKLKTLLVDDNQASYELLRMYMNDVADYDIDLSWCQTSEQALQDYQAAPDQYDLLLLDYCLDHRTGAELLNLIHRFDAKIKHVYTPAIIVTNSTDQKVVIDALRSGCSDFICKEDINRNSLTRVIHNVFSRHQLEHQLHKTNTEIERFYQTVSHELKTPLTSLNEYLSLLSDGVVGSVNDKQNELLNICQQNCQQLKLYLNDLTQVSQLKTGKFTLYKSRFDLIEVIKESFAIIKNNALKNRIRLQLGKTKNCQTHVYADQKRILQVLLNLLSNAIKFTPANGEITVTVFGRDERGQLVFKIKDTGCGIPSNAIEHIFDRLYQVEHNSETRSRNSLGLGLTICKEIIDLHGGEISAASELGKGTTITIKLPEESNDGKNTDR